MTRMFAIAATVLALAGCGGGGGGSGAEDALERQIGYLSDGQYGRLYDELHPAQQKLIDEDAFVRCYDEVAGGVSITGFDVKDTYPEKVRIPGTTLKADSVAVTVAIKAKIGEAPGEDTRTFHEFDVDGDWRFTLSEVEEWADGNCT